MATAQSLTSTTSIFNDGEASGEGLIDLQSLVFAGDAPVTIGPAPLVDYVLFNQQSGDGVVSFAENGSAPIIGDITAANICLLYTSPSPRDQRGSRMPSSA